MNRQDAQLYDLAPYSSGVNVLKNTYIQHALLGNQSSSPAYAHSHSPKPYYNSAGSSYHGGDPSKIDISRNQSSRQIEISSKRPSIAKNRDAPRAPGHTDLLHPSAPSGLKNGIVMRKRSNLAPRKFSAAPVKKNNFTSEERRSGQVDPGNTHHFAL